MPYLSQTNAPIEEALVRMKRARLVPFDVPGHKRGRGNPELAAFLGAACLDVDVNSMKMLDNLCHPVSVIRDAEHLAASLPCRPCFFHGQRDDGVGAGNDPIDGRTR